MATFFLLPTDLCRAHTRKYQQGCGCKCDHEIKNNESYQHKFPLAVNTLIRYLFSRSTWGKDTAVFKINPSLITGLHRGSKTEIIQSGDVNE